MASTDSRGYCGKDSQCEYRCGQEIKEGKASLVEGFVGCWRDFVVKDNDQDDPTTVD